MNELEEHIDFRTTLLDDSRDDEGFISPSNLISQIMPSLLDAKLVDSEDYTEAYYTNEHENIQLNAYSINESGERLQLFIVDEDTIDEKSDIDDLLISQRADYESQFKRVERIIKKAFKGKLFDSIQDSSNVKVLASELESIEGFEKFDVIEIFLLALTSSVSFRGNTTQPNKMYFKDDTVIRTHTSIEKKTQKEILLLKRLVNLNFLFDVMVSRGHREVLTIDFEKTFDYSIEAIKAAEDKNFESYLCVLKADVMADLYKHYSSRLLEKNVRSFLQFKGANRGIKETIKNEPEKFIAYNNGLTITSTKAKIFEKRRKLYIKSLSDFQIVNGGQTTAAIYFSKKEGLDVSKVKVMAKINIAKQSNEKELEELINNISKFSNAQSRVSKVDLDSRNPQLIKLKKLSDSVLTPSGVKWFFDRSKGEYNTMLRKAGNNKTRIKKEYPNARRFSKELMSKYYSAWGDKPYLVKKGGEKIFRHFIEYIAPEEPAIQPVIDRMFYEDLISKIILFRKMEKIYGQGKNAIGQIRSAVIPYSLSVLHHYSDNSNKQFNFTKIWKQEGLENDLESFLYDLMFLMNDLIKYYALSDDKGEYSKKPELWKTIKSCPEIDSFFINQNSLKVLKKYTN